MCEEHDSVRSASEPATCASPRRSVPSSSFSKLGKLSSKTLGGSVQFGLELERRRRLTWSPASPRRCSSSPPACACTFQGHARDRRRRGQRGARAAGRRCSSRRTRVRARVHGQLPRRARLLVPAGGEVDPTAPQSVGHFPVRRSPRWRRRRGTIRAGGRRP